MNSVEKQDEIIRDMEICDKQMTLLRDQYNKFKLAKAVLRDEIVKLKREARGG